MFGHDVVAVGEAAQLFAVAAVNGGQIAAAVVAVAHQFAVVEGNRSEAVHINMAVFAGKGTVFGGGVECFVAAV